MSDISPALDPARRDDAYTSEQLLPLIYQELRSLAAGMLAKEPSGQTLQATALVHEAYVRLVEAETIPRWNHRGHFFAAAAEAMRRILVEQARSRGRVKHGGDRRQVPLNVDRIVCSVPSDRLLEIDEALDRFSREAPDKAQLVKLRFFAGLSLEEAAEVLQISRATASRYWAYARAWLYDAIGGGD